VPTTLIGVALLIVLLGPGFCYVAATERKFTARKQSAFRETVQIASASIILNVVVVIPFWIARTVAPHATPNVGSLVASPHAYWVDHYRLVTGWAFVLFIVACAIGFVAGTLARPAKAVKSSAWVGIFETYPTYEKWVGLELTDGAFIRGQLHSYSLDPEETDDRELVLRAPEYRADGDEQFSSLGTGLTAVSAGEIRFLSVSYNPPDAKPAEVSMCQRVKNAWSVLRGNAEIASPAVAEPEQDDPAIDETTSGLPVAP